MELIPVLKIGWLNGWIAIGLICLTEGICFVTFPKDVVVRLFDRSGWGKTQVLFTVMGKALSLVCLVLLVLTPLKIGSSVFAIGTILFALGLAGLIAALLAFKNTPPDQTGHQRTLSSLAPPSVVHGVPCVPGGWYRHWLVAGTAHASYIQGAPALRAPGRGGNLPEAVRRFLPGLHGPRATVFYILLIMKRG